MAKVYHVIAAIAPNSHGHSGSFVRQAEDLTDVGLRTNTQLFSTSLFLFVS